MLFLFAAIGVLLWGATQRQRVGDAWSEAGRRLGMTFQPGSFGQWHRLSGQFGDVTVEVGVRSTGNKNQERWTTYLVRHPPAGPVVNLTRQAPMSGLFSFVTGRRDVIIGDPIFDERVIVHAHDEVAVREFLTPARRAAVQELLAVFDRAEIERDTIQVATRGVVTDVDQIVATVTRLVDMATVLGDVQFNAILGHRQAGNLGQAANELHEYNQGRGNRFTSSVEAETLAEAGRHEQALAAFDELWAGQPDDPVSSGWYDLAATPDPAPVREPAVVETPLVATPATGPSPLAQQAVIDDLFHSDRMSWEAVEHFEATYRDRLVDWSGPVLAATAYDRDHDFDGGPGMKATVRIGHTGRSEFVSNQVDAVVEFGPDTRLREGDEIRFSGVLANVDRFSRKIWIRHAELG